MSASSNVTFSYARNFRRACCSIFAEKSVATSCLHRSAITPLSNPVPHAHSRTSSSAPIHCATAAHSAQFAFRLMRFAKMSYAHATLSQNMPWPSVRFLFSAMQFMYSNSIIA